MVSSPISDSFSCPIGSDTHEVEIRGNFTKLISLSVYIVDDNKGPLLVSVYVIIEGVKHQIKQPTGIYDGVGYNAKRFYWQGVLPISRSLVNTLVVEWANYSGSNIETVRVSGIVKR